MEREHLIIIALILVALYMMNKDTKDTVQGMGPANRIRYNFPCSDGSMAASPMDCPPIVEPFAVPQRIRHSDKYIGGSEHIKNHIRHNNRNNMFNAMMEGCGDKKPEGFRFTTCEDPRDCGDFGN